MNRQHQLTREYHARRALLVPPAVRSRGLQHTFGILLVGFLANNVLPARSGEIGRVLIMSKYNEVPATGTLATLLVERIFDGMVLGLIALLSLQSAYLRSVPWLTPLIVGFCVTFGVLFGLALEHRRSSHWIERFQARFPGHISRAVSRIAGATLGYVGELTAPGPLLRVSLLTLLVWSFEAGLCALASAAFGTRLDLAHIGGFLASVNFASLTPTPGGLGAVELAGTAALTASGISRELAFVAVTAQHALQYAFCFVFGGFYAWRLGMSWNVSRAAPFRKSCDFESLLDTHSLSSQSVALLRARGASDDEPQVSVIVPAHNEEQRILPTLLAIIEYFETTAVSCEVIVVDDGSRDATADVVQQLRARFPQVQLLCLPKNLGKGAAIRAGMRSARGECLLFADADGATPITMFARLLAELERGADLAIGSRALASESTRVNRTLKRAIVGRTFAFIVNAWTIVGIGDTQCGFKLFRRTAARRIFDLQELDGFAFDVEVLCIAAALQYRIAEIPVDWADRSGSKVDMVPDSFRMLWDILRLPFLDSVRAAKAQSTTTTERALPAR